VSESDKLILPIKLGSKFLQQPVDINQLEKNDEIQYKKEQDLFHRFKRAT
jgi:hypothetical protein